LFWKSRNLKDELRITGVLLLPDFSKSSAPGHRRNLSFEAQALKKNKKIFFQKPLTGCGEFAKISLRAGRDIGKI